MHLMYVDESGDPGFPRNGVWPDDDKGGPTRRFVRAGVIVHSWRWAAVEKVIVNFKKSRFLDWDDEIKATDLRRGEGAFKNWGPEDRAHFLHDLLETVGRELELSIIKVQIDKTQVDQSLKTRLSNPAVRSMELLLEQYNVFLGEQKDRTGIAILDSIEQQADQNIRHFQGYLRNFSNNLDSRRIVEGTLFLPSHTSHLLQVADVCANVLFRQDIAEVAKIRPRIYADKAWP